MFSPRWHKALRDVWVNKARTILVILAIAIGIFGVGTILNSYAILTREMNRNYMDTRPASAVLYMEGVDADLAQTVKARPEIADAEARRSLTARYQMGPNKWISIVLFVIDDFDALRVNRFYPERGAWNPAPDEILIERSAVGLIDQDVGDVAVIKTAGGAPQSLTITGIVHDPGQAPSWMEGIAYGYITADGLARLGEAPTFDELRLVVAGDASDRAVNRRTATNLRDWLAAAGYSVDRVQVPPIGEHPHNDQMMTLLFLLEAFAVLALVLSGILVATMMAALMGQQLRQIGVMKTVGARTTQIAGIYLVTVMFLGGLALVIGVPLGSWGGRAYAVWAAATLNFEIGSYAVDGWVYLVQIATAMLIPLIGAAVPVYKGSRFTVREALSDAGASENTLGLRPIDALLGRVQGLGRPYLLALRNTFRRQGRLVLTLLSLAVGGAVFMVALNVGASWNRTVDAEFDARRYDAEIRLKQPYPAERLAEMLGSTSGAVDLETWVEAKTSVLYAGDANGNRPYASERFRLLALPPATSLIDFPLVEGRWLRPDDANALVVSHMLADHEPALAVGNQVVIQVNGQATTWNVVGVVRQIGPNLAYANQEYFSALAGLEGQANNIRVVAEGHAAEAQAATLQALEGTLRDAGLDVSAANTSQDGRQVLVDHLYIIVTLLMLMAVLVAAVGGLGLASTMSLNVLERRREIGVMRAVGATSLQVLQVVLGEGVFIGLLSWALAILLSLPLTRLIGDVTGQIFVEAPLVTAYSWWGVGLWLGVVMVLTAIASSLPAVSATELPVNQVLAYE